MNTSAMFGFTLALLDVINKNNPTHIAVGFDLPGGVLRNDYFPEYKAQREETPNDIKLAIPYIRKIVEAFNIPIVEMPGYEADDVIGTIAKQAEKEGFDVFMVTPDKDYGQLVTENIKMLKPARNGGSAELWGIEEVCAKFGVERTEQVIDILGLWGDSVDNIPGIPGIGEKTAKKLIAQYGSIESLLEHTEDLKGKMKENVINFSDQALVSKKLATIILDVPVTFDAEKYIIEEPNKEALTEIFSELEFRTLASRVLGEQISVAPTSPSGGQMDLFSAGSTQTAESTQAEPAQTFKAFDPNLANYKLIETKDKRTTFIKSLMKQKYVCFDTETTSVDANLASLVGMSFSWKTGEAYYIPIPENEKAAAFILADFKPFFESEEYVKIGHNLKYDNTVLHWAEIDVKGPFFDTMLAHYLIQPDLKHGMDFLSETYLGYSPISIETLIGKKGKNQKTMRDVPVEDVVQYACEDADITFQLYSLFKPKMEKDPELKALFYNIEMPLMPVLAKMESSGVNIDKEALEVISKELESDSAKLEKEIYELAGHSFNIGSPKQLGIILFEEMEIATKPKKTKSGQYATNEETLLKYESEHEIVAKILEYRQVNKLKSTYVDALPALINPKDDRIHTTYMQAVAATGRLSSQNPNLQNIPIRTERGKLVRKAFIPSDEKHIILAADYSQIELRLIAELSGDEAMLSAFDDGEDIHAATAAKVFDVPLSEVTREMRSKAKVVNFGIIYGISAFGLSQRIQTSRKEAAELIENYFSKYPGIKQFMDDSIARAKEHGYVETVMKRRRYLKDINSGNAVVRGFAERNAINAPIQGSAADMIKMAMIKIDAAFQKKNIKSKMILQVHDELVFDALLSELDIIKPIIENEMKNAIPEIKVPINVDMDQGKSWLEAH